MKRTPLTTEIRAATPGGSINASYRFSSRNGSAASRAWNAHGVRLAVATATGAALLLSWPFSSASPATDLIRSADRAAGTVSVRLQPRIVDYEPARVSVSGLSAAAVSVRIRGANDPAGIAYHWTPYPWRRLRLVQGRWQGALPAPPLRGIWLQLEVHQSKRLLQSPRWLLRVLPPGTLKHSAFRTPRAVIRDYVSSLHGNQVLVATRRWPQAAFDHRDPRLQRLFAIAYAPRGDNKPSARLGLFITTVRDGYHGRWRLLEATTSPYD